MLTAEWFRCAVLAHGADQVDEECEPCEGDWDNDSSSLRHLVDNQTHGRFGHLLHLSPMCGQFFFYKRFGLHYPCFIGARE